MSKYVVEIGSEFRKPRAEVFTLLADHDELGRLFRAPMRRVKDGEGSANGPGSVRRIGAGPLAVEETVTEVVPNERIEYRITRGGGPVRKHRGELVFSDAGSGGSRVAWRIEFESLPVVGRLVALGLKAVIGRGLSRVR